METQYYKEALMCPQCGEMHYALLVANGHRRATAKKDISCPVCGATDSRIKRLWLTSAEYDAWRVEMDTFIREMNNTRGRNQPRLLI